MVIYVLKIQHIKIGCFSKVGRSCYNCTCFATMRCFPNTLPNFHRTTLSSWSFRWVILIIGTLTAALVVSLALNLLAWRNMSAVTGNLDQLCYQHISTFPSPVDKDIPPSYEVQHVNGSFRKQTIVDLERLWPSNVRSRLPPSAKSTTRMILVLIGLWRVTKMVSRYSDLA